MAENQAGALSASGLAGVMATLSPQPQADVSLGLEKAKVAERRSTLKSICEPSRNSTAFGSMSSRTPLSSTTSSLGAAHRMGLAAPPAVFDPDAQPRDRFARSLSQLAHARRRSVGQSHHLSP